MDSGKKFLQPTRSDLSVLHFSTLSLGLLKYWSDPKNNFVFVIHKHLFVICVCVAHFFRSKINFVGQHKPHS